MNFLRIDGISGWLIGGLIAGLAVAFLRKGMTTGDGQPFSGK